MTFIRPEPMLSLVMMAIGATLILPRALATGGGVGGEAALGTFALLEPLAGTLIGSAGLWVRMRFWRTYREPADGKLLPLLIFALPVIVYGGGLLLLTQRFPGALARAALVIAVLAPIAVYVRVARERDDEFV